MDVAHALTPKMLPFVFVFLFVFTFDAIGTLIGVCEQAGFMRDNKLPRAKQAMISDAIGTVAGAALGTSTVTSFVESAAGVEAGGRTGLTGLVGRCSLFAGAVFQSADCNDRRISADHCAGADDCRSNDDAKRGED